MSYADLTLGDRSRIKRYIQEHRFADALHFFPPDARTVLDFGAGNGELALRITNGVISAEPIAITCYEPSPLIEEARERVGHLPGVQVIDTCADVAPDSIDVVYCLEVFEHLPPRQTSTALATIHQMLRPGGLLIVGVPIEVGLPALCKGLFRMTRRREFDTHPANILRAILGGEFLFRPMMQIAPGLDYYPHHTGFDYRRLRDTLARSFRLERQACSPFGTLGPALNSEVYLIVRK